MRRFTNKSQGITPLVQSIETDSNMSIKLIKTMNEINPKIKYLLPLYNLLDIRIKLKKESFLTFCIFPKNVK